MRRQLLPLFIITAACGTDPAVPMPFDHPYPQTPEVVSSTTVEIPASDTDSKEALLKEYWSVVKKPEPAVDETVDCPNPVVDNATIQKAIVALDPSRKGRFLLWEGDYGAGVLDEQQPDVRVVFVSQGIRYTIWYTGDLFSIWERPNGTYGQDQIQTYADKDATGCLNFGISGNVSYDDDARRLMRWNEGYGDDTGVNHHAYWQQRYQKALSAIIKTAEIK